MLANGFSGRTSISGTRHGMGLGLDRVACIALAFGY